eukprot:TRINITY_DN15912_c0_g2_i1.p1 TRINITY_DN15912_c0_g2~~TRINITY_DN15912_c0_g2_i1.p1  ORF type:complete len:297 (+),score=54.67 TRINITY_DN15912_c0_g2_i1:50-940(+)
MMAATDFDTMACMTGGCGYAWQMAPGSWAVPMMPMAAPVAAVSASGAVGGPAMMMPQVPDANNALFQTLQAVLGSQGTTGGKALAASGSGAPSARAIKRQRARERRRLGKRGAKDDCGSDQDAEEATAACAPALEHQSTVHVEMAMARPMPRGSFLWAEVEDDDCCSVAPTPPSCSSRNSSPSRARSMSGRSSASTATLSPSPAGDAAFQALVSKVTVKHTFIDIADLDTDYDDDSSPRQQPLPASDAFLGLGADFDEYRRAYRRFRLGHHKGARGEVADFEGAEKVDLASADETR